LPSRESTLELPSFTICVDPFVNVTSVKELGLDPTLWSMYKHANDGSNFSAWPIKDSIKDLSLYEKTTYSLKELVQFLGIAHKNLSYNNFENDVTDQYLEIQVTTPAMWATE
jgi:hypothetical protein